ncbi:hypothetical protein GUJ93_ZPchr0004g38867 [Zizania palustris]|uniref:Uncharacterized protein n=1 Tax=Zizania palustris TaxID=103762 RepID=A0A8J5T133_ZIZPA|nr:hypothetical protein GUJ93_ZPchr0004g38867 [Zizania palustris]
MAERDLESKVAVASELLVSLRVELFARAVEETLGEEATEKEKPTVSSRAMLDKTKKELKDVKENIDKAKDEVKCLHVAAASLNADLAMQRAELAARRRKGVIAASIPSLEEELSRVKSALAAAYGARAEEDVEVAKAGEAGDTSRDHVGGGRRCLGGGANDGRQTSKKCTKPRRGRQRDIDGGRVRRAEPAGTRDRGCRRQSGDRGGEADQGGRGRGGAKPREAGGVGAHRWTREEEEGQFGKNKKSDTLQVGLMTYGNRSENCNGM